MKRARAATMTSLRGLPVSGRARRYVALVLVLPSIFVSSALGFGVRVPGLGDLPALPGTVPLDYLSRPGSLAPLSSRFVAEVLGIRTQGRGRQEEPGARGLSARMGGAARETAPQRLTDVHPLTNDKMRDARYVPAIPFTAHTDTRKATRESDEAKDCSPVGESTVWYRYTPPKDIGLIANTFGTDYSTTLGVFRGRPGSLSNVGCDTDARGNSIVPFAAKKNVTYFFQVVGPAGGGSLVFNLDPHGSTRIVSVSTNGEPADTTAVFPSISGDGRLVAFQSDASNLVPSVEPESRVYAPPPAPPIGLGGPGEETNRQSMWPHHIYLRDVPRSTTTLVDVDRSGRPANGFSDFPFVSGDGRYVAFRSTATNLVANDENGAADIFVHDLATRRTELLSVSSSGDQVKEPLEPPRGCCGAEDFVWAGEAVVSPSLSWNGRFVAFESKATNLVPGDTNGVPDVFVRDRAARTTTRISVDSSGHQQTWPEPQSMVVRPTEPFMDASISGNGRFVLFQSPAANLDPNDKNGEWDAFVHDMQTGKTDRVSVSMTGSSNDGQSSGGSWTARQALSFDGRYATFTSMVDLIDGRALGEQVYVRDRWTRKTVRASVTSAGEPASGPVAPCYTVQPVVTTCYRSWYPAISASGRFIAFMSSATNLTNKPFQGWDVFIHDLATRATIPASIDAEGRRMQADSWLPSISADGRSVAIEVTQFNVIGDVSNQSFQVYVFERPRSAS